MVYSYMRKRAVIVKNIHRVYTKGDSFGALRFGEFSPCSGDLVAIQLACHACSAFGVSGLQQISNLMGAADIERKIGFVSYDAFSPIYGKQVSANNIKALCNKGLIERVPFPETFSHIKRRVKCYKVSDKGHKCLRLFRDTYNLYQREVKRAKVSNAEKI